MEDNLGHCQLLYGLYKLPLFKTYHNYLQILSGFASVPAHTGPWYFSFITIYRICIILCNVH